MYKKIKIVVVTLIVCFLWSISYVQAATMPINVNTWYSDSLDSSSDVNSYSLKLNSAGYISLTFKHANIESSYKYWSASIINSDGNTVLSRSFVGNKTTEETTKIGLPAGTYTVKIAISNYHSDIPYTLKVNYTSSGNWEKEVNNSFEKANSISVNQEINGSLVSESDADYYKVVLGSAGYISLTFKHANIESSYKYWSASIINSDGNTVLSRSFVGNKTTEETTKIGLPAGTYTVKIAISNYHSDIPYTLRMNYSIKSFIDVSSSAFYFDAVQWAVEKNITSGTSENTFSPDASCTRAQVVTFLWRAAGKPSVSSGNLPFVDVSKGSYYYDAVKWAVSKGITSGTSVNTFEPDAPCTRGQVVTFLWRAAGSPYVIKGSSVNGNGIMNPISFNSSFVDVSKDAYYFNAVEWAVTKGITSGTSNTTFSPDKICTRAEVVTFLYRYYK